MTYGDRSSTAVSYKRVRCVTVPILTDEFTMLLPVRF